MCHLGILELKKKKGETKKKPVFKEILLQIFDFDLMKNIIPQIQYTLSRISTKIFTSANIVVNL